MLDGLIFIPLLATLLLTPIILTAALIDLLIDLAHRRNHKCTGSSK